MNKPKIMVAMSGGIDSSVTALLLKNNGFYIEGAFMKNWEDENTNCLTKTDLYHTRLICKYLKIKLNIFNFSDDYWKKVFINFLKMYKNGYTPNPDILCNKNIKFSSFLYHIIKVLNFNFIATGHYSKSIKRKHIYFVEKSFDKTKDQTYFLYMLTQKKLKYILFPLANYSKKKIRNIAKMHNLVNYNKKDSMGICFIGKKNFKSFLQKYLHINPGLIYTQDNKIIGTHEGFMYYTIGQRKGLCIGGNKNYLEKPWFVISKNIKENKIFVAQDVNNKLLFTYKLCIKNLHFVSKVIFMQFSCYAKIRHAKINHKCIVTLVYTKKMCYVYFKKPQRAAAIGQSIVFYKNKQCLGGGIIDVIII